MGIMRKAIIGSLIAGAGAIALNRNKKVVTKFGQEVSRAAKNVKKTLDNEIGSIGKNIRKEVQSGARHAKAQVKKKVKSAKSKVRKAVKKVARKTK